MIDKIKIALLQLVSYADDQDANLRKGEEYCRKAKEQGADIAVL
jgi:predicted amidohydrolase